MAAALSRKDLRADDKPAAPTPTMTLSRLSIPAEPRADDKPAAPAPELMTEAMPVEAGETPETVATANPVLEEIEILQSLAGAPVEGPPTLDEIYAHIQAKDPRVTTNLDDAKPNQSLLKTLAHPIVVDSAVLAGSLFVPASLPLTLAQSRLGRSLTRQAFKETKTSKTVAARVAGDVGNMPVTRKRKRK